jgi:hypothetical protein
MLEDGANFDLRYAGLFISHRIRFRSAFCWRFPFRLALLEYLEVAQIQQGVFGVVAGFLFSKWSLRKRPAKGRKMTTP